MRKRLYKKTAPDLPNGLVAVLVDAPARLVTLEDPAAPPQAAQDAFARLRPTPGTDPAVVASWRDSVARVARAVRVVAPAQAAAVPLASTRVDDAAVGTVREEALRLAAETGDARVEALVAKLLDEVGA